MITTRFRRTTAGASRARTAPPGARCRIGESLPCATRVRLDPAHDPCMQSSRSPPRLEHREGKEGGLCACFPTSFQGPEPAACNASIQQEYLVRRARRRTQHKRPDVLAIHRTASGQRWQQVHRGGQGRNALWPSYHRRRTHASLPGNSRPGAQQTLASPAFCRHISVIRREYDPRAAIKTRPVLLLLSRLRPPPPDLVPPQGRCPPSATGACRSRAAGPCRLVLSPDAGTSHRLNARAGSSTCVRNCSVCCAKS